MRPPLQPHQHDPVSGSEKTEVLAAADTDGRLAFRVIERRSAPLRFQPAFGCEAAFHQRKRFGNLLSVCTARANSLKNESIRSARIVDFIESKIEFRNLRLHLFSHHLPLASSRHRRDFVGFLIVGARRPASLTSLKSLHFVQLDDSATRLSRVGRLCSDNSATVSSSRLLASSASEPDQPSNYGSIWACGAHELLRCKNVT